MLHKPPIEKLKLLVLFAFMGWLLFQAQPTPTLFVVGLLLALMGEGVRLWAAGHLRRNEQLITSGPYAHCRNPLYLGRFLLLSAFCLMTGYGYLIPPALAVFVTYYIRRKVRREEERLRGLFGSAFDEWARHVPCVFPRLTPYSLNPQPWSRHVLMQGNKEHWTLLVELVMLVFLLSRLFAKI
jgi:protein-S-isoprenylcysteine O-methyltransferase Ste14